MTKIVDIAEFRQNARAGNRPATAVRLAQSGGVAPSTVATERVATFVFSDSSVDRYGDTIDARGWVLDNFNANPIALFGHDSGSVENVIGKARNVRVQGQQLVGEIVFASAEENPNAEIVFRMVKGGYLNTVSVGFQPLDWAASKDKARPGGVDFKKQELLEISIVPIPANPNALVQARAAGIDVDRLKLIEAAKPSNKISTRGLYEVSWLAQLLAELDYLEDCVEWEADSEGDGSAIPRRLTDALKALGQILVDMTVEEVMELVSDEDGSETVPIVMDDPAMMSALTPAQKIFVAMVRMARVSAAAAAAFAPSAPRAIAAPVVTRAGKVLSAANKAALSEAHGCITKGCDIMKGIIDAADGDTGAGDDDATKDARAIRLRFAEAHKLRALTG